jgi:hypothetical protein
MNFVFGRPKEKIVHFMVAGSHLKGETAWKASTTKSEWVTCKRCKNEIDAGVE